MMNRIEQLRNLVVMAVADGSLGVEELRLLAERAVELQLDEYNVGDAIHYALGDDAALELPTSEEAQEALLTDLIRMMAADGQLTESEKRLFAVAAAKMNYGADKVNALIDRLMR